MRSPLHRDALSAWRHLREEGGLEIDDRDEGLEDRLIILINPAGANLEQRFVGQRMLICRGPIPRHTSVCRHVSRHPQFLRKSRGERRTSAWNLQVDETIVGLEHFRRFLTQWDEVECTIEAPAVDQSGAWALFDETRDLPEMQQVGRTEAICRCSCHRPMAAKLSRRTLPTASKRPFSRCARPGLS